MFGLKGLSQPAAKVASLSTAWMAAIVGGLLIGAIGAGVGGWVGVGGGLSGRDSGGEPSDLGVAREASPTASPPALAVRSSVTAPAPVTATRIVFRSSRDPEGVYTMDADGRNIARIGTEKYAGPPIDPQWSPDGSRVAFHQCPDTGGGYASLYVMNADGTGIVHLAQGTMPCGTEGDSGGLSWSPDGSRIVFLRGSDDISVVNADGTNLRHLTDGRYPGWSPSGGSIVFRQSKPTNWRCPIYSIDPDGANLRLLADAPCEGSGYVYWGPRPHWSPDGSMFAFSANEEPSQDEFAPPGDIFVVRADGSGLTNITNDPANDHSPLWANCDLPTAGCEAKVTIVAPDQLNVRGQPGAEGEVLGQLSEGDVVCLTGSPFPKDGYKWWPARGPDYLEGWAAAFEPTEPSRAWLSPTGETCSGDAVSGPPTGGTAETRTTSAPIAWQEEIEGYCWTGSIAALSPNAWRCSTSGNRIHDPCFANNPTDTSVICGRPFRTEGNVKLNLTQPLPAAAANKLDRFNGWRLDLVDGVQCDYITWPTGTRPEDVALMMGAGIQYSCNDGWYVAGVQVGGVWIATKVQWSEELNEAIASAEVPVKTVWR
jgi:hypothetical protein